MPLLRLHFYAACMILSRCIGLLLLNLVVDASFIADMGLQPFMGYWDEEHDVWVSWSCCRLLC